MATLAAITAGGANAAKAFQTHKAKIAEAKALREQKNRVMSATTREMAEEQRNKEHMHSRAITLAAAGGGGVDDPTVANILGDLNAEGEYRVLSTLWTGQNEAEALSHAARMAEREGRDILDAAPFSVVSSAMSAYVGSGGSFGGGASSAKVGAGASGAVRTRPKGFQVEAWGY